MTKTRPVPDLPETPAKVDSRLTGELATIPNERKQEKLERKPKPEWTTTWLAQDPRTWVGKKLRMKKNGATYTVRNVYKNERVELEKSWMTYTSDVPTIRADYETCI